jgi:hypothetical protein
MGFNDINLQVSGPQQPASIYKTKVLKGQVPFAVQVTEPNTKYVIKHNFELDDDVTIPVNCILEFDGGSLTEGEYNLSLAADTIVIDPLHASGSTANRPTIVSVGFRYFDTTLGKPIWYNGTDWVDTLGNAVDTEYQTKVTGTTGNFAEFDADGNLVGGASKATDFQSKLTGIAGNFAGFGEDGNLTDSGSKAADFQPAEE